MLNYFGVSYPSIFDTLREAGKLISLLFRYACTLQEGTRAFHNETSYPTENVCVSSLELRTLKLMHIHTL